MHRKTSTLKIKVRQLRSKLKRAKLSYKRIADAATIVPDFFHESSDESLLLSEDEYSNKVIRKISNTRETKKWSSEVS